MVTNIKENNQLFKLAKYLAVSNFMCQGFL